MNNNHSELIVSFGKTEIVTNFVHPPIPDRRFDYQAYRDGYDEGNLMGWGETKDLAIADLLEQEYEALYE
jgi:hypothetical protein